MCNYLIAEVAIKLLFCPETTLYRNPFTNFTNN